MAVFAAVVASAGLLSLGFLARREFGPRLSVALGGKGFLRDGGGLGSLLCLHL